jgi:phosphomannomutase
MSARFLFDVDGTLTPSRGKIQEDFRLWLCMFLDEHDGYLVTGSDQLKTIEQLGEYCYRHFLTAFQCNGNQVYRGPNDLIYENKWVLPEDAELWLQRALKASEFVLRTGQHIEHRSGMVNFSVVGRGATLAERQMYVKWDRETNERSKIAEQFNTIYNPRGLQAQIGGETGLDITPIGKDKSQVLEDFDKNDTIYFFGDACHEGGNDYPLAKAIIENNRGFVYNVKDYKETWNILKEIEIALSSIH